MDQNYSLKDAAKAVGVGKSTLEYWVRKLRKERQGKMPPGNPLTPDQRRINDLEKQLKRVEMEQEILKKATALLMSDSLSSLR